MLNRSKKLFPDIDIIKLPLGIKKLKPCRKNRQGLGLRENSFIVTTLCRHIKRKQLNILLEGISILNNQDVQLIVMGDGPERKRLMQMSKDLHIGNQVLCPGRVSEKDKISFLHHSDVFCLPSIHEAFGVVFLEAMNLSNAILCSSSGGQLDIVSDKLDGFLLEEEISKSIARRLEFLYENNAILAKMQNNAQRRSEEFLISKICRLYKNVYHNILPRIS